MNRPLGVKIIGGLSIISGIFGSAAVLIWLISDSFRQAVNNINPISPSKVFFTFLLWTVFIVSGINLLRLQKLGWILAMALNIGQIIFIVFGILKDNVFTIEIFAGILIITIVSYYLLRKDIRKIFQITK